MGTGGLIVFERANKNWLLQHYFNRYSTMLALFLQIGFGGVAGI
jgi:hypothetical protein